MSSPTAISSAEDTLLAAQLRLARLRGTHLENAARREVTKAQRALVAVREATHVVSERQCCGSPMKWSGRAWICARGMTERNR